ncbi:MAG: hypothetical protein ACI8PZ_005151 [Myxococcota bacterium]|jgi:hypothetical protein
MHTIAWLLVVSVSEAAPTTLTDPTTPTASSCPSEHLVKQRPDLWRAELESASPEQFTALLGRMGLPPIPADLSGVKLDRVDIFRAPLTGASEPQEAVVQAKFTAHRTHEPGQEQLSDLVRIYRIQVLERAGPGVLCALGADLSVDQPAQVAGAGPIDGMHTEYAPLTFGFTTLTYPDRQTIEVVQPITHHSRTTGTRTTHTFWDIVDGGLVQRLALEEADVRYPGAESDRGWFERSGAAPQRVTAFRMLCPGGGAPCEGVDTTYTFTAGAYSAQPTEMPVQCAR